MKGIHSSFRSVIALILVVAIVLGFGYILYDIQIVNHEYYISRNNAVSTYTVPIEAVRGDIVDRNGNVLVTNRQANNIMLKAAYFPPRAENAERNKILYNLIKLFEKNGEEYVNNLPLELKNGQIVFTDDEAAVAVMKGPGAFNVQSYATAQNCFEVMKELYGLEEYGTADALKIGGIRYELTLKMFSIENSVTIAEDVCNETVAAIKEDQASYLGADVKAVTFREYTDSTLAPHIIGTVRKINADEYGQLKESGYGISDYIGGSGIESAMESVLRGTPGELTITIDTEGRVTEEVTKAPVKGSTVALTIDKDLQRVAQEELKKTCDSVNRRQGAGAVVMVDVKTGQVLAAASYPTYDIYDYYNNYSKLAKDPMQPMYNRFALGLYAPGSTFKPAMACAALEEGAITENTTFTCQSPFMYYDQPFKCQHNKHGNGSQLNVSRALRDSCNVFFYNCAIKLGITKMNEYASMFGLGEKTGVEINEAAGVLAGPASAEKYNKTWHPGDTVQSAIGQSDNLFSTLQLANYCATIANGGTRYELHLVKAIIDGATGSVDETNIVVAEELPISQKTLSIVKGGMRRVATETQLSSVYGPLAVDVACKTGTSTVYRNKVKANNGFLISFAPYKNPEIAIASAIEWAGSGSSTSSITAALIDYYYSNNSDEPPAQQAGTLLN